MKKNILFFAIFLLLISLITGVAYFQKANIAADLLDRASKGFFPQMSAVDIKTGRSVKLTTGQKGTLIHFWATWCSPCIAEMPELLSYVRKLPSGHSVYIIAGSDKLKKVKKFLSRFKSLPKNVTFLFDGSGDGMKKMGTFKLPETYIYNADGKFVSKISGANNWKVFPANLNL